MTEIVTREWMCNECERRTKDHADKRKWYSVVIERPGMKPLRYDLCSPECANAWWMGSTKEELVPVPAPEPYVMPLSAEEEAEEQKKEDKLKAKKKRTKGKTKTKKK